MYTVSTENGMKLHLNAVTFYLFNINSIIFEFDNFINEPGIESTNPFFCMSIHGKVNIGGCI